MENLDQKEKSEEVLKSEAKSFLSASFVSGLIGPILEFFLFFIIFPLIFHTTIYSVYSPHDSIGNFAIFLVLFLLSITICIPFGVISIIYGIKARNIVKILNSKNKTYILAISIGCLNVVSLLVFYIIFMQ